MTKDVDEAYMEVVGALSKGMLVRFNTEENDGAKESPELHVDAASESSAVLSESPNRGVCDWEVSIREVASNEPGRVVLYHKADTYPPKKYENVITMTIVGYDQ